MRAVATIPPSMAASDSGTLSGSLELALADLEAGDEGAELEFIYYSETENKSCLISAVKSYLPGITDSTIDILSLDKAGSDTAGNFHNFINSSHSISNTIASASPPACLTPVQLKLMQPPMHSTPMSTHVGRQLMLQESFEERNSESNMISHLT